ncbi:MAG TPA: ATP-binding protein [Gemmataceae bacterium]|nr:ATP-binding protein [Gemmataceae bacterium]
MPNTDETREGDLAELKALRQRVEQAEAERQQAVAALRRSEERFSRVFHASPIAIAISTLAEGRFLDVNDSFLWLHGYRREEVIGRTMAELDVWPQGEERSRLLEELRQRRSIPERECSLRLRSGQVRDLSASMELIELDGEPCVLTRLRDITEHKRLEAQFLQAQKMEAVGRLAGGVAHDFNNLLTIITGYADLTLAGLGKQESLRASVKEIKSAAERATALIRQLLLFSRRAILTPVVLDLNVLVSDLDKMLRRLIGEDIELTTALDPALRPVKADPGQLEQVLMNLAINARDAMPHGGKLLIETRNVELSSAYVQAHREIRPGPYVLLAVSDTGCGMDAATKAHLFEPFFTTKEAGKGTGLGLATVYGIVKQSGGYIYVYSEPGHGASFKIYLPPAEGVTMPPRPRPSAPDIPRGTGTVLLVEDEEGVRTVARQVLQHCGYQVLEARHSREALRLGEQHPGAIDLLVTDVVMPQMSGRQLADRLARLRPNLRVLYMSGYTDDAILRHGILDKGVNFIEKPFAPEALARTVSRMLARS